MFTFLARMIQDLNVYVGDTGSWLHDVKQDISAHMHLDERELRKAITPLYELKRESSDQVKDYLKDHLSVIPPKYVLRKLEWKFVENGMNDAYVRIEEQIAGRQSIWDSSQRQGSDSVDAAVWNDFNQEGACYECKLAIAIEQDQVDLLACIWYESDQKVEVGLASFASAQSMKERLRNFNVPSFVRIVTRNEMFRYWPP